MSWQPDTSAWNPPEPAEPADPYRPAAETPSRYDQPYGQAPQPYGQAASQPFGQPAPPYQPYGQPAPQFQAYGQPAPAAQAYGQPAPQFQPYGQPAPAYGQPAPQFQAYGQPYGVPYGQLPGWAGPTPIEHRRASRGLLAVSGLGVGIALLLLLAAAVSTREPALQVVFAIGGVLTLVANGAVLTLTIVGRRQADQGKRGVLLSAGIVATSIGALGLAGTISSLASGGNAGGFIGGGLYLAAGIGVIRAARS